MAKDLSVFVQLSELIRNSRYTDMSPEEREDYIQNEISKYPPEIQKGMLEIFKDAIKQADKIEKEYEEKVTAAYDEYTEKVIAHIKKEKPEITDEELEEIKNILEDRKKAKIAEGKISTQE